jgi:UDP-N-acetylmuramoyl-L-alanyl-D-glutamate--2,6-diaminopimelate ligase
MSAVTLPELDSPSAAAHWLAMHCRGTLRTDHRQVRPGDAFLAWPGRVHDARAHLDAAWAAGAVACLLEREGLNAVAGDALPAAAGPQADRPLAAFSGLRREAGEIASLYWGVPTKGLDVVAVTGTNGKTSTTWWIAQALRQVGRRCAVAGTLGVGEPPELQPSGLTTPDAVALQTAFAQMARAGVLACAIEASSIGLAEHRLAGTRIAVAAFTNLTRDHLDYHGTMEAYGAAKRALFDWPGLRAAVVHVGDACGAAIAAEMAERRAATGSGPQLWTVARDNAAAPPASARHLTVRNVRQGVAGLAFDLCEGESCIPVDTGLVGDFNVENLLVVAGCLRVLGLDLPATAQALGTLQAVPGRMQRVCVSAHEDAGLPEVVVDYAHTPDALDKVLAALAPRATARGGALWCVFGCGGDRDASKRGPMGAVAALGAAQIVVTSDNPRSESPAAIIEAVMVGARQAVGPAQSACLLAIEDRRAAIVHAVAEAAPQDLIVIAGKGHETTQEIAGQRRPFDDVAEASQALRERARKVRGLRP